MIEKPVIFTANKEPCVEGDEREECFWKTRIAAVKCSLIDLRQDLLQGYKKDSMKLTCCDTIIKTLGIQLASTANMLSVYLEILKDD